MASTANIHSVDFGTGCNLFRTSILPAIETARSEVIIVTCFWAPSETRDLLCESLLRLSSSALQHGSKTRVRIGFSSCSLFQKLLHTSSPKGRTYQPQEWGKVLGLPGPEDLTGLDLEVKSMFFLPFSVWHPKFVVIDRRRVFLPSCNVSWEDWFEGCVEMSGPIVEHFTAFWREYWANDEEKAHSDLGLVDSDAPTSDENPFKDDAMRLTDVPCKFLPSQHHRNPNFRLPWQQCAPPPSTPLNNEILELLAGARKEVYVQTPNVTSPPVLEALLDTLKRGVNLKIVTSERLMILEQMVTAGTTTSRCMKWLIKTHQNLQKRSKDEEAGPLELGRLHISYYTPQEGPHEMAEPVQSHLKLTMVDRHAVVFGSGNMDRASWYTSQELGVAFLSDELCSATTKRLEHDLMNRTSLVYDSEGAV